MKIIRREKACFRKVQGERWGVKFESFEAGNVYVAEVDVDSNDKEALKKIDDELYKLAKRSTHNDIKQYIKEQRQLNKVE